jgi:hypothetical protein
MYEKKLKRKLLWTKNSFSTRPITTPSPPAGAPPANSTEVDRRGTGGDPEGIRTGRVDF